MLFYLNLHFYLRNSKELLNNLVKGINSTYVLSFNYTELRDINLYEVENVHGKLSNEIIFGIDYENIEVTDKAFKYSKTYRKLLMNINDSKHSSLPQGIKKIICFWHSLADADYSYFQSIMDEFLELATIGMRKHHLTKPEAIETAKPWYFMTGWKDWSIQWSI
ncbi:MAG: AbiH family protein [Mycoplasma sp.]